MNENVKRRKQVKNKKINLFTKICLTAFGVIIIILVTLFGIYIKYNKDIYNKLLSIKNFGTVNIETYSGYAFFAKANIKYITEHKISIIVTDKNNIAKIILKPGKIESCIRYNINISYLEDGIKEIATTKSLKLSITSEKGSLANIDKIVIKDTHNMNNVLSLYTKKNGKYIEEKDRIIKEKDIINLNTLPNEDGTISNEYVLTYIPVQKIEVSKTNIILKRTYTEDVKVNILPVNCTNKNIEMTSSDEKIAILSSNGKLTASKAGKADILLKVTDETVESKITVHVQEIANKITLSKSSITLYPKGSSTVKATVKPKEAINSKIKWTSSNTKVATIKDGKITAVDLGKATITVQTTEEPIIKTKLTVNVVKKPVVVPAPAVSSTEGLTYIKGILLVNKKYSIPSNYNPGVNSTAAAALSKLKSAAKKAGYTISTRSGFRSYNTQKTLYARYVSQYGVATTETFSAQAGHSEHQTGLAFDVGKIDYNYGNTPAGKWLATNAHNYGFIIRYPKGKKAKTGYRYEPWHIRYVGTENAIAIYNSGLCLEEYLGV